MESSEQPPLSNSAIRRASLADIDNLGVIAPAAYAAAYLCDDSAALARQIAAFSAEFFANLLERADTRLWVAQVDRWIIGFLTMVVGSANPITDLPNGAEIPRIYLLPGAQGLAWEGSSSTPQFAKRGRRTGPRLARCHGISGTREKSLSGVRFLRAWPQNVQ